MTTKDLIVGAAAVAAGGRECLVGACIDGIDTVVLLGGEPNSRRQLPGVVNTFRYVIQAPHPPVSCQPAELGRGAGPERG